MKLSVLSFVTIVAAAGCNDTETQKPAASRTQVVKKESVVVVPGCVKGKWKAVKVQVTDKSSKGGAVYTVGIGSELKIPDSGLTLRVDNFLPHFVMDGTTLTSQSNELKNPAAQMIISEAGREIYRGWLFSLYPSIHAFQHPQYGFTLVGYDQLK